MRHCALLLLLSSGTAFADLAPPPPEELDCPRGAKGAGNGVSVWCEPTTCANDLSCGEGYRCSDEDIGLCVEPIEVATQRQTLLDPDVPTTTVRSVRRRGCEPDGTCLNVDSTCEQARRCIRVEAEPDVPSAVLSTAPVAATPPTTSSSGCACRTSGMSGDLALFFLVLLVRRRGEKEA